MKIFRRRGGFSMIELMLAVVVIFIGLGSLFIVLRRGMNFMKTVGGKNFAVVAVSSEIEMIKAIPGGELPGAYEGPFLKEVDLSTLPNSEGMLKIEEFEGSGGGLRKVTATVTWIAVGKPASVSVSTLVGSLAGAPVGGQ